MAEETAAAAAGEAAALGVNWIYAPMVDIARDPRWGRIAEGAGEDPYLGAAMARARVRGFQHGGRIAACPKHFAAYGGAEGGRDYDTVDISERTLREIYLPPFQAALAAGAGSIMSAFNELNGVPATANRFLLTRILREEWGFAGFVVSDCDAVKELIPHGVAASLAEAAEKAFLAGVDMDMNSRAYAECLADLVRAGRVPETAIDEAVRRILRVKFRLGLFECPLLEPPASRDTLPSGDILTLALQAARKSIVLLKNERALLPLGASVKSLAVIGPLADDRAAPLGCWAAAGRSDGVVTVLEAIEAKAGSAIVVHYAKGCEIEGGSDEAFAEAVRIAGESEAAVVVLGESAEMCGEGHCRASLDLPGLQEGLLRAVHATGTPVVLVLMNGRPLTVPWAAANVPAILETWFPGSRACTAIADVLFGACNPGGRLAVTFPRSVGQVPIRYNHKNTGRPPRSQELTTGYMDLPPTPLFPFGHGLSYTNFAYRDLMLGAGSIRPSETLTVGVTVMNTGQREGDEVVQLYLQDPVAGVARPVKELKGFRRITLGPGEERKVEFTLAAEHFGFYGEDMRFTVEPGAFKVWVGPSSAAELEGRFEVVAD